MPNREFVGARLELVRTFHGFTLRKLADEIGVSYGLLSHYENQRKREPSAEILAALSQVTKVKADFFFAPVQDIWREEECSFRRRKTTPEALKKRARAHGTLVGLIIGYLDSLVEFPRYNVPSISVKTPDDIERAAERVRAHWKLDPDRPIKRVERLLESAGVIVIQHLAHSEKIDAFSRHGQEFSVIVLNSAKPSTSRRTFDIAHELGHLVMHLGICTGDELTEAQANYFAGAFMMPRRAFGREFRSSRFSWPHTFDLKKRWGVSAQAILRRAYQLELLDPASYLRSMKYMSWKGWIKNEPNEPEKTEPELLQEALIALRNAGDSAIKGIGDVLHLTDEFFTELTGLKVETAEPSKKVIKFAR